MRVNSFTDLIAAAGANPNGKTLPALNGAPTLFVDGTTGALVGTIALQVRPVGGSANTWVTIGTPVTATGIISPGIIYGDCEFRAFCSAYTSGNAPIVLQVAA